MVLNFSFVNSSSLSLILCLIQRTQYTDHIQCLVFVTSSLKVCDAMLLADAEVSNKASDVCTIRTVNNTDQHRFLSDVQDAISKNSIQAGTVSECGCSER